MKQYLPFYMTYSSSICENNEFQKFQAWDDEMYCRRDYDYMKSAYPDMVKRIVPYVENECDRLEYSGSIMYDEYPDQLQMRLVCRRIYDKVMDDWIQEDRPGKWLSDLIHVMTWQEILKRRNEYRKYRRKFY